MYIYGINGPVVKVKPSDELKMLELVKVGEDELIGEVIGIEKEYAVVQVYEGTTGLTIGEKVSGSGMPFSVQLAPGILSNIFDGIERPLNKIAELSGSFISRGLKLTNLDETKKWKVAILAKAGDRVHGGSIIGQCQEIRTIIHKIMIPPNVSGVIREIVPDGEYTITEPLVKVELDSGGIAQYPMLQQWPIREKRPVLSRKAAVKPFITGQRVIDTLFPIAKGGTAAVPGGFGTGNTMTQHQIAKWSDADIIVYIGCGERGNEMTQVLEEFSELADPRTGGSLMDRTVLIANTSNMPVAAREASIYTGITLAEYYRDMGYNVAIMADSTSRWAEALREISGRLEEMPAEEGFPAYLPSRIAGFYERAGVTSNLNGTTGSVTIIGAVSPQGGDFSEPVTQNTKRFTRSFLTLDKQLAYARHYPAINWLTSYSEYIEDLTPWFSEHVQHDFMDCRAEIVKILQEESNLMEIVKLIGGDVLPDDQKLTLEIARVVRIGFLQQNAYHKNDTYVPLPKQYRMMKLIIKLYRVSERLVGEGIPMSYIKDSNFYEEIVKVKYEIDNDHLERFDEYEKKIDQFYDDMKNAFNAR